MSAKKSPNENKGKTPAPKGKEYIGESKVPIMQNPPKPPPKTKD